MFSFDEHKSFIHVVYQLVFNYYEVTNYVLRISIINEIYGFRNWSEVVLVNSVTVFSKVVSYLDTLEFNVSNGFDNVSNTVLVSSYDHQSTVFHGSSRRSGMVLNLLSIDVFVTINPLFMDSKRYKHPVLSFDFQTSSTISVSERW